MDRKSLYLLLLTGFIVVSLLTGCGLINEQRPDNNAKPIEDDESSTASSRIKFESLDDYIQYADHIVSGTVSDISQFDEGTNEYAFTIDRQVKNHIASETILLYDLNNQLSLGESYLLFLEAFEGGLYPSTIYKVHPYVVFEIDKEQVHHHNPFVPDNIDLKTLMETIETSSAISKIRIKDPSELSLVVIDVMTDEERIAKSDVIAHIKPTSISSRNKYMTFATVETIQSYTLNRLEEGDIVMLPADIEVGEEYLVFLQNRDGYIVTTKTGSVVNKKDETTWNTIIKMLETTH